MAKTSTKTNGLALQMLALVVTGLTLAVVVMANMPWLNLWLNDLTTPPLTANYPYNDFGAEGTVVRLLNTPQHDQMFDAATQLAWEQQVWGDRLPEVLKQPFVRVPWSVLVLWPFAQPPHAIGFLLLAATNIIAMAIALALLARWARLPALVAAAFVCGGLGSLPLLRNVVLGQHSGLMLLVLTGAILWSLQKADVQSGLALAVSTALKPHLVVLIPLGWLMQTRWKALIAGAVGLVVLTLGSLLAIGPTAFMGFFTIQGTFDQYFPGAEAVEQMQNWRGLVESTLGIGGTPATLLEGVLLLASAAVVVWAWWPFGSQKRPSADLRWGLTMLASLLFTYHLHFNDLTAWAIPAAIGLRRVYSPDFASSLSARGRQVAVALAWVAWFMPWLAYFFQAARPALFFMLLAGAVLAYQIVREARTASTTAAPVLEAVGSR